METKMRQGVGPQPYGGYVRFDHEGHEFEGRIGRCYELAEKAITSGLAPAGAVAVHGSWHGPEGRERIGHGWVQFEYEGDALIWEPITSTVYDAAEFARWTACIPERVYTAAEVMNMQNITGTHGRWHESDYR